MGETSLEIIISCRTHYDFVICRNAPYGQVLVLPSRRLVRPAADDDFVTFLET